MGIYETVEEDLWITEKTEEVNQMIDIKAVECTTEADKAYGIRRFKMDVGEYYCSIRQTPSDDDDQKILDRVRYQFRTRIYGDLQMKLLEFSNNHSHEMSKDAFLDFTDIIVSLSPSHKTLDKS